LMVGFRLIVYSMFIILFTMTCFAQQTRFTIANAGKSRVAIVISKDATIPEQTAAKELSGYLKQITGGEFPVYSHNTAPSGMSRIIIGQSEETKRLLGNIDWGKLRYDGTIIRFAGNDLVLAGDRPRGTLYAVYSFLEEYVGCKWWTADSSFIPNKPNLSVSKMDKIHIPPFMYRETYYYPVNHKNLVFASRLKLNGTYQEVPAEYGGHYNLIGFVHTFDELLPASIYLNAHPEWYSLVDGKRVGGQSTGQLCLTNEEMKAELVKQALNAIDRDPSAGMISISQNDNTSYCQCEKCMAVAKEEGSQSGLLIRFVNTVADEISKKHPDFLVETLAYTYTRHAPKIVKPRDNVIVRLCSIECDFATPLNSKSNASFYKDLQDWKNISKRLYVWDYVVNFWDLTIAHPNWQVLAPNIRLFAKNNVVGVFEQGDGFNKDAVFGHLKIWVLSHLMWDPSLDTRKLMKEFADGYYGTAGPCMLKYLDITSKAIERSGTRLLCCNGSSVDYLDQKDMDESTKLFDKAELLTSDNPEILNRIRIERLALDHTWILQTSLNRAKAGTSRGMDVKALCEDFISRSEATGNNYLLENWSMDSEYHKGLRLYAGVPCIPVSERYSKYPVPVKGLKPDQWVELQENKINMHKPGEHSFIEADSDASNRIAIRMPGNILSWASQIPLDKTGFKPGTKVDVYITVKAKTRAVKGLAFTTGIYDDLKGKYIVERSVMIQDVPDSKYHDYKLGRYTLGPGWLVYVAPAGDATLTENVYVDRVFILKSQ